MKVSINIKRFAALWLIALGLITQPSRGQNLPKSINSQKDQERKATTNLPEKPNADKWLIYGKRLTGEILESSHSLSRFDQTLLNARLSVIWQQRDKENAALWRSKALQEISSPLGQEEESTRRMRLATTRALLKILPNSDKVSHDKLINILQSSDNNEQVDEATAEALVRMAEALVETDPKQSLNLAVSSLRIGNPPNLAGLLWKLRKSQTDIGDTLFYTLLAKAKRTNYDYAILYLIPKVIFEGPTPSDSTQRDFLLTLAEGLQRPYGSNQEKVDRCKLTKLAAPLLSQFHRLLPAQASMVQSEIAHCLTLSDASSTKPISEALIDRQLETVDDLLEAAKKPDNSNRRSFYLSRAVNLAASKKEYDKAISILGEFTLEDRKGTNGAWENWRWSYAASSAIAHFNKKDSQSAYGVIESTPVPLRAFTLITVATSLADEKEKDISRELFTESRKLLDRHDSPETVFWYLGLVRRFTKYYPAETISLFRETVQAFNKLKKTEFNKKHAEIKELELSPLFDEVNLRRYDLPATILEIDAEATTEALNSLNVPLQRIAMLLKLTANVMQQIKAPSSGATVSGKNNVTN